MKIIAGARGSGKTTKLIEESAASRAVIVVPNRNARLYTIRLANQMGLKIPSPITHDELLTDRGGRSLAGRNIHLLIDDVDLLLAYLCRLPIDTVSITWDLGSSVTKTYQIINNGQAIKCLRCGLISYNRNDVEQLYCGNCKIFHEDLPKNGQNFAENAPNSPELS